MSGGDQSNPIRKTVSRINAGLGRSQGFSLVELLVTLALLIILLTVLTRNSSGNVQKRHLAACQLQLHTLHVGLQLYAGEHEGRYPAQPGATHSSQPLSQLQPQYISTLEPFFCPGPGNPTPPDSQSLSKSTVPYAYYQGRTTSSSRLPLLSDAQINSLPKTNGQQVFSLDGKGPGNNHHRFGGNILFQDGEVLTSPPRATRHLPVGASVQLLSPTP